MPEPSEHPGARSALLGGDHDAESRRVLERCPILHVDMDAFFAAVEVLDDPTLAGKPVIVGGAGRRGVVASCTYEARAFGIRSAMSSVEARRRCPEAIFVAGRHERYAQVSERLHELLRHCTPLVEGVSLDEAYLDVSGSMRLLGSPLDIAHAIRHEVHAQLSLRCSVGVARTKLVAKLASRAAKPVASRGGPRPGRGVVAVTPEEEIAFLHPLPVRALWGVGPSAARRLDDLGVRTVGDLAAVPTDTLCRVLGAAHGLQVAALARGEDPRPVVAEQDVKSVGHEETFAVDLHRRAELHRHVVRLAEGVATRLRRHRLRARTVTVKIRFADRTTVTRSHTMAGALDSPRAITVLAEALLDTVDVSPGVRLLGVSTSSLTMTGGGAEQLTFADTPGVRREGTPSPDGAGRAGSWEEVERAVFAVRARYGDGALRSGTLVAGGGSDVEGLGDRPWGPSDAAPT